MIAIVKSSGGTNLRSVCNAVKRIGLDFIVTDDASEIRCAKRVILPGVGHADAAMKRLRTSGIAEVIRSLEQPVLGICLGMQILFTKSDEGQTECLDLIHGRVDRIEASLVSVPHMGWNRVFTSQKSPLFEGVEPESHFFFAHSYRVNCRDESVLAETEYGERFPVVVRKNNFFGVQFHPEKSGVCGQKLLANFLREEL